MFFFLYLCLVLTSNDAIHKNPKVNSMQRERFEIEILFGEKCGVMEGEKEGEDEEEDKEEERRKRKRTK